MDEKNLSKADGREKKRFPWERLQTISAVLAVYDAAAVNLSYFLALWIRFDCRFSMIEARYLGAWFQFAPFYTAFCLAVFCSSRLYKSLWRFASYTELLRVTAACLLSALFHAAAITLFLQRMPVTYYCMGAMIQLILISASRFSYRVALLFLEQRDQNSGHIWRVLLIGAGMAGQTILRDIARTRELRDKVICIIDDDPNKWGRDIDGVPIVGGRDDILASVEKYRIDKIYVAIPRATAEQRRDILDICKETGCELKILPGMYQLLLGTVTVSALKNVDVADLLGREPITVDLGEIFQYLKGKVILVTGGGGSIGSELCRQIASHQPKELIIFDISENYTYAIQLELRSRYPDLPLRVEIGSVRDNSRLRDVFQRCRPEVVYHAAAHKHVPLMECSPCEAIKNNAAGTYKTAYAAMHAGCRRFVLISTDKAVNPTNIMGASKRLCEMIIQTFASKIREGRADDLPPLDIPASAMQTAFSANAEETALSGGAGAAPERMGQEPIRTEFVAVRFGNVLGSNGSVIPIFRRQIAEGGPVTVTHPDIIRYFMTISEAVSLVLQAGLYAKGGEIFVLDMGTPVKIDTLARNLIKLSGYRPDIDIPIAYTGLRPGEKLYEEKLMEEEGLKKTKNDLIHIARPIPMDTDRFLEDLRTLAQAACEEREDIRALTAQVVPTYHPAV